MLRIVAVVAIASCSAPVAPPTRPPAPSGGSPFERFATMTPTVGEVAPGFELADSIGATVKLADALARGPVVLVWGSFT